MIFSVQTLQLCVPLDCSGDVGGRKSQDQKDKLSYKMESLSTGPSLKTTVLYDVEYDVE